jgi:multicomponent Na+:H+ antiporter subunit D
MSDGLMLFLPLIIPAATAVMALALRGRCDLQAGVGVAGALALFFAGVALVARADAVGVIATQSGGWAAPYGITLVADRLAAAMVAVAGLVALAGAIYALRDLRDGVLGFQFVPLMHFLLLGVQGSFLTGDLFNLYVWFEVMLVASFVLLTLGNRREQLEGALKYVILNVLASSLFLIGAGLIYAKLGTLNMADVAVHLAQPEQTDLVRTSGVLLLAAFGLKAGIFPLFFWLPASYHTPRPVVSAIFAGMLTKVGVYALLRTTTLTFAAKAPSLLELLYVISLLTMVVGVLGAAAHFDMRRILSFHSVSQIGYIVFGIAMMTTHAVAGAIFYALHHMVVKTNLFFLSGVVQHLRGTNDLARLGGMMKAAPGVAVLFFISAFSLAGVPPLSGFWAKLSLIQAGLDLHAWGAVGIALGTGVLTLFSMTKIWAEVFWKAAPEDAGTTNRRDGLLPLLVPCLGFAGLTVALGLWGGSVFAYTQRAAEQLLNPSDYIETVLGTDALTQPVPGLEGGES